MTIDFTDRPHRRFNPLMNEWVLVSPHRTQRPWQGQVEDNKSEQRPEYDSGCYLCPGNTRANGEENPAYDSTFVFTNDYSALLPDTPDWSSDDDPLFRAHNENGRCRVICFSPRHDLTVASMELDGVVDVVRTWVREYAQFSADPTIAYAQIFENKGDAMGCSNPHPHCQIWATSSVPNIVQTESETQAAYLTEHGRPMLLDYVERETARGERVIYENQHFVVVVPYWAVWPFEALILPKSHRPSIATLTESEIIGFADAYHTLTGAYNRLFDCEFPYSAGIHQAPTTAGDHDSWQMHMHFYPPLLRSATVRKFMVGYEMLGMPQRDVTPEYAAEALKAAL
jgi:UDPglucose--hexose-1-phosphate uridylyltransferase